MRQAARVASILVVTSFAFGPGAVQGFQAHPSSGARIDHVILSVGDLDRGMDQLEARTGVRPVFGGNHPGRGTRNALMALGPRTYLELLAPQEGTEAPGLLDLKEPTPTGWAASTQDLLGTLRTLAEAGYTVSEPMLGSRATPAGELLEWRTGGVLEPFMQGGPFFIEWGATSPHPATTSPGGCTLLSLTVSTPDAEELGRLIHLFDLPVIVVAAEDLSPGYQVRLQCPTGEVIF